MQTSAIKPPIEERMAQALLGVNLDHVATIREARRTPYPYLHEAVLASVRGGADQITIHLREDRRHIQDADLPQVRALTRAHSKTMNLEMACTDEMIAIAQSILPDEVCLVPERREELSTEGGLDVIAHYERLAPCIQTLQDAGIVVSLFIEAERHLLEAAKQLGVTCVEFHTGSYALATDPASLLGVLEVAIQTARQMGLQANVGHGLHYQNAAPLAQIPGISVFNIGHAIVARALFVGLEQAVSEMRRVIDA